MSWTYHFLKFDSLDAWKEVRPTVMFKGEEEESWQALDGIAVDFIGQNSLLFDETGQELIPPVATGEWLVNVACAHGLPTALAAFELIPSHPKRIFFKI